MEKREGFVSQREVHAAGLQSLLDQVIQFRGEFQSLQPLDRQLNIQQIELKFPPLDEWGKSEIAIVSMFVDVLKEVSDLVRTKEIVRDPSLVELLESNERRREKLGMELDLARRNSIA